MSEAGFDITSAEEEFEKARVAREAGEVEKPDDVEDDEASGDKGEREDPPTYMTHDEWVDAGRDPEDYIGKKAFQKRHDDIQEAKRTRRELKGMRQTVKQSMEAMQEWQGTERAKIKAEAEAKLHKAKEDEDVDGAIEAQKKLDKLEETKPAAAQQPEPGAIQDFRVDNPIIDPDSEEFDPEFHADVRALYNDAARQLGADHSGLTDGQIKRCLRKAMKGARELHEIDDKPARKPDDDDDGESPRNKRPGNQQRSTRRTRSKGDDVPKAEEYKLENPRNKRNVNAASEVRDVIRKSAETNAAKLGKSDADIKKAGDTAAKNFERSIA